MNQNTKDTIKTNIVLNMTANNNNNNNNEASINTTSRRPLQKKQRRSNNRLCKKTTKIAIIGTGPSGLSAALSLQQAGYQKIQLYERDSHFNARKDGYGLTLTYNPSMSTSAPLAKLGILEKVARMDCPSRSHYVFDPTGKILGYYGNTFSGKHRGCGQRGNLRVPRQCLRKIMMDTLIERDCDPDDDDKDDDDIDDKGNNRKHFVQIHWGKKLIKYTQLPRSSSSMNNEHDESHDHERIQLSFEDGSTDIVNLLIGADGVRSVVMKQLLAENESIQKSDVEPSLIHSSNSEQSSSSSSLSSSEPKQKKTDLSYLGIMIVLGITDNFFHPLLDERGFYTLDGEHRLFTMPFEGSRISDLEQFDVPLNIENKNTMQYKRKRRYMWQLSYKLESLEEASTLSKSGPQALLDEVLRRTNRWHQPVQQMMKSTPLETIWGTPLMDREPNAIHEKIMSDFKRGRGSSRIFVLGDSIHAMSPFKGQGCNQALMDGPLLTSWLEKSSIDSAMKGFMREMTQRTNKKVMASRDASVLLHSEGILSNKEDFAGVRPECIELVLQKLAERNIGAHLGAELDTAVSVIIGLLGAFAEPSIASRESTAINQNQSLALQYAADGDLPGLRKLSLSDPISVQSARDKVSQETCLHLAAKLGHYHMCKWLLSEACVEIDTFDKDSQAPLHKAIIGGDLKVINLISRASKSYSKAFTSDLNGNAPLNLAKQYCDESVISLLEQVIGN